MSYQDDRVNDPARRSCVSDRARFISARIASAAGGGTTLLRIPGPGRKPATANRETVGSCAAMEKR